MVQPVIDWPESYLGVPLQNGFRFRPVDVYRRVELAAGGLPRYRENTPRYSFDADVNFSWTEFQFSVFRNWFDGAAFLARNRFFNMRLPLGGVDTLLNAGIGWASRKILTPHVCHFRDDWNAAVDTTSNRWAVSFGLEIQYAPPSALIEELAIDGGLITEARPIDIIESGVITDPRPDDAFDAGTVNLWWTP